MQKDHAIPNSPFSFLPLIKPSVYPGTKRETPSNARNADIICYVRWISCSVVHPEIVLGSLGRSMLLFHIFEVMGSCPFHFYAGLLEQLMIERSSPLFPSGVNFEEGMKMDSQSS
jgi:hypothetical protein